MANFRHSAVTVIGHRLDHDRDAVWAVALIHDLVVIRTLALAHAALYRSVNGVIGHVLRFGVTDRLAKTGIRIGIAAAASFGGDGDLLDHLRKDLATLSIECTFF